LFSPSFIRASFQSLRRLTGGRRASRPPATETRQYSSTPLLPPSPSTTPSHLPVERGVNAQRCARIRHLLPRNQQCRNVCQRKLAGRGEIRVALFVPVLRPARRQFSRAKLSRNVTPPGEKRTMGGKREIFLGELPRNGGALPFATDETLSSDGPPNGGPNSWVFISACNIHGLIPQISGLLPKPSLRLE